MIRVGSRRGRCTRNGRDAGIDIKKYAGYADLSDIKLTMALDS